MQLVTFERKFYRSLQKNFKILRSSWSAHSDIALHDRIRHALLLRALQNGTEDESKKAWSDYGQNTRKGCVMRGNSPSSVNLSRRQVIPIKTAEAITERFSVNEERIPSALYFHNSNDKYKRKNCDMFPFSLFVESAFRSHIFISKSIWVAIYFNDTWRISRKIWKLCS